MHDAFLPTMCFKLPTVTHYIRLGMVIARVRYAHTNSVALTKFSFVLSRKTYSCPVQKRPKTSKNVLMSRPKIFTSSFNYKLA